MLTYHIIFLISVLFSFFYFDKNMGNIKLFYILFLCISIILIIGMRFASTDYFSYLEIYNDINSINNFNFFMYDLPSISDVEIGFAILVLIEKALFGHYFIFVFIFALISNSINFYAFKRLSPYFIITIIVFLGNTFFWKELGQMRNAMSMGLILLSLIFVNEQKFYKFIVTILVAITFHFSSVVAFPLYFIRYFSKKSILFISVIISIVISYLGGLGSLLLKLSLVIGLDNSNRIVRYATSKYSEGISFFGGTYIVYLLPALLFICYFDQLIFKWKYNKILIPTYIYGTTLMFIFIDYGIVSLRIKDLIIVPTIAVVLPTFILLFNKKQKIIAHFIIIIYSLMWFVLANPEPYETILQFLC